MQAKVSDRFTEAKAIFRRHGGILGMSEAPNAGIRRRALYAMLDAGVLERLCRGLYRLSDLPALGNPDLVSVALKVPSGVLCLISALAYHEITTQIPHEIYIAIPRRKEPPRLDYPPIRTFLFSGEAYARGIETHDLDGVAVRIYSPEKTLADCFKYRNKIGLEVAIEGLKLYRQRQPFKVEEILRFARVCRMENVMRPYLEALL